MIVRNGTIRVSGRATRSRCGPVPKARTHCGSRRGVTLVELLVTITILAILGSAVLFASFSANQAARAAATRAKVASLHSLVTEKYDEFAVRRFDDYLVNPAPAGTPTEDRWAYESDARLKALRVLMRMEMPDRWSDVVFRPVDEALPSQIAGYGGSLPNHFQYVIIRLNRWQQPLRVRRSVLSQAYLRRYAGLNPNATAADIVANEGAECLYMIITMATADGEALGMFRQSDIGDVDGDGAPEFLDGWGRPIQFLHAAPGFTPYSDLQSGNHLTDHDPFDSYRVDVQSETVGAFRLVPLIYSAGADGDADLATGRTAGIHPLASQQDLVYHAGPLAVLGLPLDDQTDDDFDNDNDGENWHDNIHNHDQSVRQ